MELLRCMMMAILAGLLCGSEERLHEDVPKKKGTVLSRG